MNNFDGIYFVFLSTSAHNFTAHTCIKKNAYAHKVLQRYDFFGLFAKELQEKHPKKLNFMDTSSIRRSAPKFRPQTKKISSAVQIYFVRRRNLVSPQWYKNFSALVQLYQPSGTFDGTRPGCTEVTPNREGNGNDKENNTFP